MGKIFYMVHRGEIIKKRIEESGCVKQNLAKYLGKSRKTLENWYEVPNLEDRLIHQIGRYINYDFSQDIPDLLVPRDQANEPDAAYGKKQLEKHLLEKEELMRQLLQERDRYKEVTKRLGRIEKHLGISKEGNSGSKLNIG